MLSSDSESSISVDETTCGYRIGERIKSAAAKSAVRDRINYPVGTLFTILFASRVISSSFYDDVLMGWCYANAGWALIASVTYAYEACKRPQFASRNHRELTSVLELISGLQAAFFAWNPLLEKENVDVLAKPTAYAGCSLAFGTLLAYCQSLNLICAAYQVRSQYSGIFISACINLLFETLGMIGISSIALATVAPAISITTAVSSYLMITGIVLSSLTAVFYQIKKPCLSIFSKQQTSDAKEPLRQSPSSSRNGTILLAKSGPYAQSGSPLAPGSVAGGGDGQDVASYVAMECMPATSR